MSYSIIATPKFKKALKKLSKKYTSLKNDFADLLDMLEVDPEQGTFLGKNCWECNLQLCLFF